MKDKIEVGEYIRTENGQIYKIEDGAEFYEGIWVDKKHHTYVNNRDIIKHSPNIIDLIEVGDIIEINNKKYEVILDKSYEKLGILIPNRERLAIRHCSLEYIFSNEGMKEFEIKSIVTKEQFKEMEYRV